jgi:hypothetical protein
MKASVYIETTIVSYLLATPSKDLVQAAHQHITRDWWAGRDRFALYVSAAVVAEARRGDAVAAARRLKVLSRIPLVAAGPRAGGLVRSLLRTVHYRRRRDLMPPTSRLRRSMGLTTS